jgi:peptidylprolyl isomerase
VGTAKRERQKANRQLRLEELAKEARRDKSKKWTMRVVLIVVGLVALVGIVYLVGGKDNSKTSTTIPGSISATTLDPNAPTTTVPPKPTVVIPKTLPTTLKVTTLHEGKGDGAKVGDTLEVHYIGVLSKDGTVFDNSYDKGQSFSFQLGAKRVIGGWDQGLVGAKAGGQYQLDIPADLAYGAAGQGSIGPNEPLTFVIDVMAIKPAPAVTGAGTVPVTTGAAVTTAAAVTTTKG